MFPPTHFLVGAGTGLLVGTTLGLENAVLIAVAGAVAPDLDELFGIHRRTLHWPFLGTGAGLIFISTYLLIGSNFLGLSGIFMFSFGLHALMDWFAGAEIRSWRPSERRKNAVYDHLNGRWLSPKRWMPGAGLRDIAFSSILAALFFLKGSELMQKASLAGAAGILMFGFANQVLARIYLDDFNTWTGFIDEKEKKL